MDERTGKAPATAATHPRRRFHSPTCTHPRGATRNAAGTPRLPRSSDLHARNHDPSDPLKRTLPNGRKENSLFLLADT